MTGDGDGPRTVVICNGRASWGFGREAARTAAQSIRRAVENDGDLARIADIVYAASRRARTQFDRAGADAPAFSVLAACADECAVDVAWVGDVELRLIRDGKVIEQNDPHVVVQGASRVITAPLPGESAWERTCFLERRRWAKRHGDLLVAAGGGIER